ncbi:uncharacterized protein LOC107848832 [Capsicum annuum]|uniref:uncharacterized protein LOC107848832 n=1 Tax=Capsicum annuum TaxID=4072 RepID=UPI001FB07FF7|nr:uncharacterized protein LOC107848832 [Capsicum annuum]
MCKNTKLTHLIFADDLMLFCKGDLVSIQKIVKAIKHFSATTGLVANLENSNIYLAGVEDDVKQHIHNMTGFTLGSLPMRYLGLPLSSRKWNKLDCHQGWTKLLVESTQETDRKCKEYLWGKAESHIRVYLVTWSRVCLPKKFGVLNIKGCEDWNIASIGKLLWQLATKRDVLWVKWVNEVYVKINGNDDLMVGQPGQAAYEGKINEAAGSYLWEF